jgi:hypothetical protein
MKSRCLGISTLVVSDRVGDRRLFAHRKLFIDWSATNAGWTMG